MAKTMAEILERDDYKNLVPSLKERSVEIAEKVMKKMIGLNLEGWGDYRICKVKSHSDSDVYLGMRDGDYAYVSLTESKSYYYCNDFNCWVEAANNKMRLEFLNGAKQLLKELDEYETDLCEKVQKTLEEVKDL